jgi:hypothetical protein
MNGCFYFGCWHGAGHYLHTPGGNTMSERRIPEDFPIEHRALDACLLPPNQPQTEGLATLCHLNGWTILAFWDRSVDTRPGCNSAFLARGTYTFETMVGIAKDQFFEVWNRFKFDVRLRT